MQVQDRLDRLVARGPHRGAAFAWGVGDGPVETAAAGELAADTPFHAASATKLVTTALVELALRAGAFTLEAPFRSLLPGPETARLHLRDGVDRTDAITVGMLLRHTSGLPDYFEGFSRGRGLLGEILAGRDQRWSFAEAMEIARRMGPVAMPGDARRARYSDTNFQLLGALLEAVAGEPYAAVVARAIAAPLGLRQTLVLTGPAPPGTAPVRFRGRALDIPLAMASFGADGGLVTTAREGLALVRGLFGGAILPAGWWQGRDDWRPMAFPLAYGTGLMRFALPRILTGLRRMPPLIGHSGLSGAVLFHAPETGLCIAGTTNDAGARPAPYRVMAALALRPPGRSGSRGG